MLQLADLATGWSAVQLGVLAVLLREDTSCVGSTDAATGLLRQDTSGLLREDTSADAAVQLAVQLVY